MTELDHKQKLALELLTLCSYEHCDLTNADRIVDILTELSTDGEYRDFCRLERHNLSFHIILAVSTGQDIDKPVFDAFLSLGGVDGLYAGHNENSNEPGYELFEQLEKYVENQQ